MITSVITTEWEDLIQLELYHCLKFQLNMKEQNVSECILCKKEKVFKDYLGL